MSRSVLVFIFFIIIVFATCMYKHLQNKKVKRAYMHIYTYVIMRNVYIYEKKNIMYNLNVIKLLSKFNKEDNSEQVRNSPTQR